jgi:hypothetical protein
MLSTLLLAAVFTAADGPGCTAVSGWNGGRAGTPADAACGDADYREARRLGDALRQLRAEREDIERRIAEADAAEKAELARRQRQIDTDLEAIRGIATIRSWPLDVKQDITP